jgi:hypothetical protein
LLKNTKQGQKLVKKEQKMMSQGKIKNKSAMFGDSHTFNNKFHDNIKKKINN